MFHLHTNVFFKLENLFQFDLTIKSSWLITVDVSSQSGGALRLEDHRCHENADPTSDDNSVDRNMI